MDEIYVGEYSVKQNAFHIDLLVNAVGMNKGLIAKGVPSDYLIICFGKSYGDVAQQIQDFKEEIGI